MPPAFNLSQDQTLQFNSCSLVLKWNRKFPSLSSILKCETLFLCSSLSTLLPKKPSHTYRFVAKFLKNFSSFPFGGNKARHHTCFFAFLQVPKKFFLKIISLTSPLFCSDFLTFARLSLQRGGELLSMFLTLSIALIGLSRFSVAPWQRDFKE